MNIWITKTDNPEIMREQFLKNPLDFLYHQEDKLEYKNKTVSYLVDEIQDKLGFISKPRNAANTYKKLSTVGRRRFSTILNQLNALCESSEETDDNTTVFFLKDLEESSVDAVIISKISSKEKIENAITKVKQIDCYTWEDMLAALPEDCIVYDKWSHEVIYY